MKVNEYVKISKKINNINLKDRTKCLYNYLIRSYILPNFEDLEIEYMNKNIIQQFLIDLAERDLSTNTIKLIWRLLKTIIKETNVNLDFEDVIIPQTHEKKVEAFTKQEQKQIENNLNILETPKHVGILLSLYLGLRLGEVLALKWEDIDFFSKMIYIRRTVYEHDGELVYTTPKTKSSIRIIPLPSFLEGILKKIKAHTKCEFIVSNRCKPITPRAYQHFFKSLQNKARISKPKGFHSLRHSFATRAIECGMDVKSLADLLGHKNPNITLNRYAHSMMDYKKSLMNKIGKLYN